MIVKPITLCFQNLLAAVYLDWNELLVDGLKDLLVAVLLNYATKNKQTKLMPNTIQIEMNYQKNTKKLHAVGCDDFLKFTVYPTSKFMTVFWDCKVVENELIIRGIDVPTRIQKHFEPSAQTIGPILNDISNLIIW